MKKNRQAEDNIDSLTSLLKVFDTTMLSDQEWQELVDTDIEQETELFRAFRKFGTPEYASMDPTSQAMIRNAVLAASSNADLYSREILQRLSLPFDPITNPQLFFTTLHKAITD